MNNKEVYPFYTHIVHLRFKDNGELIFWSDISNHPIEYRTLLLDKCTNKKVDTLIFLIKDEIFQLSIERTRKGTTLNAYSILFWSLELSIRRGRDVQQLLEFLKRWRKVHELEGHLWIIVEDMKCLLLKNSNWKEIKDWSLGYLSLFSKEDIKDYSWEVVSKGRWS